MAPTPKGEVLGPRSAARLVCHLAEEQSRAHPASEAAGAALAAAPVPHPTACRALASVPHAGYNALAMLDGSIEVLNDL